MAKDKTLYTCNECGGSTPRWLGKCPACGAWNSLVESVVAEGGGKNRFGGALAQGLAPASEVMPLSQIEASDVERHPTGQDELDRVLGGGVVEGGVVLIGGDPGIGKSTLLLRRWTRCSVLDCPRSTSPAKKAARRWRCARAAWAWAARRCRCSPRSSWKKFWPRCRRMRRVWP